MENRKWNRIMNDERSMSEEERRKLIYDLKSLIQKATEEFSDNTLLDSLNEIKCLFDMGYAEEYIENPDFDGLADAYKCFNSKNKKPMTANEEDKTEIGQAPADRFNELYNQLQEFLHENQKELHKELMQSKPNKIRISYYEGSYSSLKTVLLFLEYKYF